MASVNEICFFYQYKNLKKNSRTGYQSETSFFELCQTEYSLDMLFKRNIQFKTTQLVKVMVFFLNIRYSISVFLFFIDIKIIKLIAL